MRVLGIDPGIGRVGWGIIDFDGGGAATYRSCGCITTHKGMEQSKRISAIVKEIKVLIDRERPSHAVVEKLFFSKNKKTAMDVSESRGAILFALDEAQISHSSATPLEVKMALTGNGRAEKGQVAWMVMNILKIKENIKSDDALDALALCFLAKKRLSVIQ